MDIAFKKFTTNKRESNQSSESHFSVVISECWYSNTRQPRYSGFPMKSEIQSSNFGTLTGQVAEFLKVPDCFNTLSQNQSRLSSILIGVPGGSIKFCWRIKKSKYRLFLYIILPPRIVSLLNLVIGALQRRTRRVQ
jgi:hypothetical protein